VVTRRGRCKGLCTRGACRALLGGAATSPLGHTMASLVQLETPRLLLRPLMEANFDDYAALCGDAEVMRYVGDHGPLSREDAWRQFAMLVGHWTLRGFGMWAVHERSSAAFVGRVGLHYPDGWPDRELAWALARRYWGNGYAFEAAAAALRVAFETLAWPRIVSVIAPSNLRSIRLAERLGERFERSLVLRGREVALYSLDRQQWHAA
jgi:RimJ/RimL family protein N-acetyltransferase